MGRYKLREPIARYRKRVNLSRTYTNAAECSELITMSKHVCVDAFFVFAPSLWSALPQSQEPTIAHEPLGGSLQYARHCEARAYAPLMQPAVSSTPLTLPTTPPASTQLLR